MDFKSEKINEFEKALSEDKDLAQKYEAIIKRITDNKEADSDGEALVKAVAEVGYDIPIEELERSYAAIEEASDEMLDTISGGGFGEDDEYGHELHCLYVWHCFGIVLHTETKNKQAACWKDYLCNFVSKES